nr:alpha/beta hydrolase [Terrisporobacter sp.]
MPTLILHGTHDKVCPFEFEQYMNDEIQNSILVPLCESGHGLFAE